MECLKLGVEYEVSRSGITPTRDGYFYTYVTNTSQSPVSFDNMVIKRWAPMVRVVYDYYPYGLTWENPKLPDEPEGVHDHAYQDKEFQFAEFSTGHGLALYDFHARMYDPATGRWLVPDPAEQFHNPYLAMANNPVSYVDPDGEIAFVIVGAVVGAYIGGAMANDHLNPGKWDFHDPNTWVGIGVGGTIGAIGGHGLMAAKGKAAYAGMSKGSAAAKAGGKKLFGSTVGGTTNAISNYDGSDSFGWGTLADFTAGSLAPLSVSVKTVCLVRLWVVAPRMWYHNIYNIYQTRRILIILASIK